MLKVRDLCCIRDDRVLFEGLSFELAPGMLLQIEGANGSGKSSLMRILCGLLAPEEGEVLWRGLALSPGATVGAGEMVYVGHVDGVTPELSARENLSFYRSLIAAGGDIDEALSRVGLQGFEDTRAVRLSAGQRRRLSLARLFLGRAMLWLLDEPFTALDGGGRRLVRAMLARQLSAGGMAVVSTHHPLGLSDDIALRPLRLG